MHKKTSFMMFALFLCIFFFGGSYIKEENLISIQFCYQGETWVWTDKQNQNKKVFTNQDKMQKWGRQGNFQTRSNLVERVHKLGFSYEDSFDFTFLGLREIVDKMCKKIDTNMVDAKLFFNPDKSPYFSISQEKTGYKVEKEKLYKKLLEEIKQGPNVKIDILPKVIKPTVTKEKLVKQTSLISKFETNYASSSVNRKNNIETAISKFNGMILSPNTVYSFNAITGRRTQANGYKEANIIMNNEYTQALGGGVCQVSTTLYNALLLAGVNIKEVHSHSLASSYVMLGFDAMVNFGSSDLKWENTRSTPIYLRTYANGQTLGVEVFGVKNDVAFERVSKVVKTTKPPADKIEEDNTLFEDETFYKTYSKEGKEVHSYLEAYKDKKLVSSKLIRRQTYKSVQGVKVVGTKQRPPKLPQTNFQNTETENQNQTTNNFTNSFQSASQQIVKSSKQYLSDQQFEALYQW